MHRFHCLLVDLAAALLVLSVWASWAAAQKQHAEAGPPAIEHRIEHYLADREDLRSFHYLRLSPTRLDRLDRFTAKWHERLAAVDFAALGQGERIDYLLLRDALEREQGERDRNRQRLARLERLLPFAPRIVELEEARWKLAPLDARAAAEALDELAAEIEAVSNRVQEQDGATAQLEVSAVDALWLARELGGLRSALERWFEHYANYDPGFAWWAEEPYGETREALQEYRRILRVELAGQKGEEDDPLVGDPVGRERLEQLIALEYLPYTPEELLTIGEQQFAWCERELLAAAGELGYGDDWRAAVEHVKGLHALPGEQAELVASQAREMIAWLDENELVTIPALCRETWRVEMISKEGQRTNPFAYYGGQKMVAAFPTAGMSFESKVMALRGNNIHFTRCVTPHELIPGHHLQGFMAKRYNKHRRPLGTAFGVEGWALHWEMLEWDLGWPRGPEDRIGMLYWRKVRAARIVVSLAFHLGRMTPERMIEFLVERVGLELDAATSEVRRYIGGGFGPLYQCAYLIGGLQLRALHAEQVGGGAMTHREFHDAVLRENTIPIELVRAALTGEELTRERRSAWKFAEEVRPSETDWGATADGE